MSVLHYLGYHMKYPHCIVRKIYINGGNVYFRWKFLIFTLRHGQRFAEETAPFQNPEINSCFLESKKQEEFNR